MSAEGAEKNNCSVLKKNTVEIIKKLKISHMYIFIMYRVVGGLETKFATSTSERAN